MIVGCSLRTDVIQPATEFDGSLDLRRLGLPDPMLCHQLLQRRPMDPCQALELMQQPLSHLHRALTGHTHAQQDRQQFRVAQLIGTEFSQSLARALGGFEIADAVGEAGFGFSHGGLLGARVGPF